MGSEVYPQNRLAQVNVWPSNRAHHRYKLDPPIPVVVYGRARLSGVCRNIGTGGACLQLSGTVSVGQEVEVEVNLPGLSKPLRVRGTARHANGQRCGVEFLSLGARQREWIDRLGENHSSSAYILSPDPEIVRSAQQALQEFGVSMVRRGAPCSLPLTGPHVILIDSDWPDYVDVLHFLRDESREGRLIVVALLGPEVSREQYRELAAHMTLPKPVAQGWFRKALGTAANLLVSEAGQGS